jgi:hypothetical protein
MAFVLGPFGYNKLMLGMPLKEAAATGLFRQTKPETVSAGCLRYTMLIDQELYVVPEPTAGGAASTPAVPLKGRLDVLISPRYGVVELDGGPLMHSPEGIGAGAPEELLAQAYPQLDVSRGTATVQVSGNPDAVYVFGLNGAGTVTSFSLRLAKPDCSG